MAGIAEAERRGPRSDSEKHPVKEDLAPLSTRTINVPSEQQHSMHIAA